MRRVLPALLAFATAASMLAPAQAATNDNPGATMASVVAGSFIGLPISIVRHQYIDIVGFTKDFVGKDPNPLMYAVAIPLCVPTGFINGMMSGIGYNFVNAWKGSHEQPFSQKAFSLGPDIEK